MIGLDQAVVTLCVSESLRMLLESVVERFVVQEDVVVSSPPVEPIFHLFHGIGE